MVENNVFKRMFFVSIACIVSMSYPDANDALISFCSSHDDYYSDGTCVADGECYALVWNEKGKDFSGFNADGTLVSSSDRLILVAPLAENGRCPNVLFQVPSDIYSKLADGVWSVCALDTRDVRRIPVGLKNGALVRVNKWEKIGIKTIAKESNSFNFKSSSKNAADGSICIQNMSSIPSYVLPPVIKSISLSGKKACLSVSNTFPFLTYAIASSHDLKTFEVDYSIEAKDGDLGNDIVFDASSEDKCRFFKIVRFGW